MEHGHLSQMIPWTTSSQILTSVRIRQICVQDQGSVNQQAREIVGGVPMLGVMDMGADVTMGGSMFKRVAAAAKLHKRLQTCLHDIKKLCL